MPRPISTDLFSGLRIALETTNTFLDTLCNVVSEKNTCISNEFTDLEKSSIERSFGHQKIGANAWAILPEERITLERQALRVTSKYHCGSECTRPSAWAPGRAAKMSTRRQRLTFSRKFSKSTSRGQFHLLCSRASGLLQKQRIHFWIPYVM